MMSTREWLSRTRRFLADTPEVMGFSVPYVFGGGLLGALFGSAFGSTATGFRVGVILGGVVAFLRLRRKTAERL